MVEIGNRSRRSFIKQAGSLLAISSLESKARANAVSFGDETGSPPPAPLVQAEGFESRVVYRSPQRPSYAAWISFYPGERGQWYISCEEITGRDPSLPRMTRQRFYEESMPMNYDESQLRRDLVLLESRDGLNTWEVISREPCRLRQSAGTFAQARTKDGRFLRFGWASEWLDPERHPGSIFFVSTDNAQSWQLQPPFHDRRVFSYAHRLRTLRDGTLVLALPFSPPWGQGTACPIRACTNLNADTAMQMNLCFSYDQGRTWTDPLPIYGEHAVSETDFVELPSGDLLCINSSIFPPAGRQVVYRTAHGWIPTPFEKSPSKMVPETVVLTEEGLMVGCLRNSHYLWSDDGGLNWYPLEGIPDAITHGIETYQPWMQYLGDSTIVNAGHYGHDSFYGELDQYVMLHRFRVRARRKSEATQIEVVRDFDESHSRWLNAYTLKLTCGGKPLAGKLLEFYYAERWKPGYDDSPPLAERMKLGGEVIGVTTDAQGLAHVAIPRLDSATSIHHTIKLVVRFNADGRDADYKPAQSPQLEYYSKQSY
jgi:hypothetical protein